MAGDAFALVGANVFFLAAGLGVLEVLTRRAPVGWNLVLAYMAGVAAVGFLTPLLLIVGLSIGVFETIILCALLALPGCIRRGRRAATPAGRSTPLARVAVVVVAAFLVLLAVDLWFQPLWAYDGWAMWTAKARALVALDGLNAHYFAVAAPNPEHPLLLSSLEAIDFRFMGGINTQIVHLQFWLLVAGFLGALVCLLRDRVPATLLWPLVLAIALSPALAYQTATAYADIPLGIFVALAGVAAHRWLTASSLSDLGLLVLFCTAALATKFEGVLYVGALLLTLVILIVRTSRRRAGLTLCGALVALVGVVPWRIWMLTHDVRAGHSIEQGLDTGRVLSRLDRLPLAVLYLLREMLDPTSWLVLTPLAIASATLAVVYGAAWQEAALPAGTAAIVLVGFSSVYWLTSLPSQYDVHTWAPRVTIPLVLLLASLAPLLLAKALEGARGKEGSARRFDYG